MALIGAPYDDDNSQSNSGSVYVFTRSSSDGRLKNTRNNLKLHANDPAVDDYFGSSVSLRRHGVDWGYWRRR